MTESEAIKEIRFNMSTIGLSNEAAKRVVEARDMAISALEEIQQYRALGTVEELRIAKEKQIPKKPTPIDYKKYMDVVNNAISLRGGFWCPNCKHVVLSGTYCNDCGQKLDWSDAD